MFSKDRRWTLS